MAKVNSIIKKLEIINAAKYNGNISQTCKQFNISRTQFYKYKKKFDTYGIIGLKKQKIIKKTKYGDKLNKKILALVMHNPSISCASISNKLKQEKILISHTSIFKILKKFQLEKKSKRWLMLEEKIRKNEISKISSIQKNFLSTFNTYFTHYVENNSPTKNLSQDIVQITIAKKTMYLYILVDSFSNYTFATISENKHKKYLIKLIKQVINFMPQRESSIVLRTSELNIFAGDESCIYQKFLMKNNINQKKIYLRPYYDGCIEHFVQKAKCILQSKNNFQEARQKLQHYLLIHNQNYSYKYYPNYQETPIKKLQRYFAKKKSWSKAKPFLTINNNPFFIPLTKINLNKRNIHSASFVSMLCSYEICK